MANLFLIGVLETPSNELFTKNAFIIIYLTLNILISRIPSPNN
jgi:hypothetical protein